MSEQTVPDIEIRAHGRPYELAQWDRSAGRAIYHPKNHNYDYGRTVLREWQDENRTWLTIDEVYATRWDCINARVAPAKSSCVICMVSA